MDTIHSALRTSIATLRLLEHPFYRRWQAGELLLEELAGYASQYRHFEAMLPDFLGDLVSTLPDGKARRAVEANLADELGDPTPHLELFDRFANAVGAEPAAPSPLTADLLAAYDEVGTKGPVFAIAGLLAYESQASEIARSKAEGLRSHYGIGDESTSFWDRHATVEVDHTRWSFEALASLNADPTTVSWAAGVVAEAWWGFLDEREAARPAA